MFTPFGAALGEAGKAAHPAEAPNELNDMRSQLAEMQKRIDSLVKKDGAPAKDDSGKIKD